MYNCETTGVLTEFGIRAGLTVGNPRYWSMLSLVFAKLFEKLQTICENSDYASFYSLHGIALISESPYLVLILKVLQTLGSRGWILPVVLHFRLLLFQSFCVISNCLFHSVGYGSTMT